MSSMREAGLKQVYEKAPILVNGVGKTIEKEEGSQHSISTRHQVFSSWTSVWKENSCRSMIGGM